MTRAVNNRVAILIPFVFVTMFTWMLVYYIMPNFKAAYANTGTELNSLTQIVFRSSPAILFAGGILIGAILSLARTKQEWSQLLPIGIIAYWIYIGTIFFAIFGPFLLSK